MFSDLLRAVSLRRVPEKWRKLPIRTKTASGSLRQFCLSMQSSWCAFKSCVWYTVTTQCLSASARQKQYPSEDDSRPFWSRFAARESETDARSQHSLLKSRSSPGSGSQISNIWRLEINPAWSYRKLWALQRDCLSSVSLSLARSLSQDLRLDGCCSWINPPGCDTMSRRWCYPMCMIWFLID